MHQPLSERAKGRWKGILGALGIPPSYLNGKHGPCPICADGTDRFRWDDDQGRGTFICSQCDPPAGDGVSLVMRVLHLDFKEAAERIEAVIGDAPRAAPRPERSAADKLADAMRMWRGAKPVVKDDPVDRWLAMRVGPMIVPPSIRYAPRARYQDNVVSYHPCMVAPIQEPAGAVVNVHRTYLAIDGSEKANVPEPRRYMSGDIPKGSAVRLGPAAEIMGVAEGIETAFAASLMFGITVWAALNEVLLAAFIPPAGTKELFIFGDNDPNFVGQHAAYALARRITKDGIRARVELPIMTGRDWNNEWNDKRNRGRAA